MVSRARQQRRLHICERKQRLDEWEARSEARYLSDREGIYIHAYECPYSAPGRPHWHVGREHGQEDRTGGHCFVSKR